APPPAIPDTAPLRRDPAAAPDRHVVRESRLAREEDVVLDVSAPRDARLAGDETAPAEATVVPDLHEVVDLGSRADHRVVHAAAIDRRVGPDLHVVPDGAATHLGNLAWRLAVLPRDVAEAVRAESHARVQNDAVAHDRAAVAHHLRQQLDVVAELHAVSQHGRGDDAHVLAEAHAPAEHRVGTDRHRLLPGDGCADHRRPVGPALP